MGTRAAAGAERRSRSGRSLASAGAGSAGRRGTGLGAVGSAGLEGRRSPAMPCCRVGSEGRRGVARRGRCTCIRRGGDRPAVHISGHHVHGNAGHLGVDILGLLARTPGAGSHAVQSKLEEDSLSDRVYPCCPVDPFQPIQIGSQASIRRGPRPAVQDVVSVHEEGSHTSDEDHGVAYRHMCSWGKALAWAAEVPYHTRGHIPADEKSSSHESEEACISHFHKCQWNPDVSWYPRTRLPESAGVWQHQYINVSRLLPAFFCS